MFSVFIDKVGCQMRLENSFTNQLIFTGRKVSQKKEMFNKKTYSARDSVITLFTPFCRSKLTPSDVSKIDQIRTSNKY
jgi:hypothetical protein